MDLEDKVMKFPNWSSPSPLLIGLRVNGLVALNIVLESLAIMAKKKCFNGEIEDITKTALSPGFTLKTGSPPNFFSRRIVISGVIECETSCLVGYAIAPEDLDHVS